MTYSFIKPDSGPSPRLDVGQINTNFSTFQTIFTNNHKALNNVKAGDHTQVIFELQTADPGVTENLDVLYCKDASSKAGTQPQLFVQIPKFLPNKNNTAPAQNTPMQLTYNVVNTTGPVYQSFLPGGYLIYFGSVSGNTAPNVNLNITVIVSPAPTKLLIANATPNTLTTQGTPIPFRLATTINTTTNDRFIISSTSNGTGAMIPYSFGWVAIGTV